MTSPVTPADTARHLRRLAEQRKAQGRARAERLRERLPAAVALLRGRYGAGRVLLFGSLALDTCHAASDVDLAVTGLRREDYFRALGELMEVFGAPVDLVELETAPPSLVERVEAEGEPL
jgi:hypothetical protein